MCCGGTSPSYFSPSPVCRSLPIPSNPCIASNLPDSRALEPARPAQRIQHQARLADSAFHLLRCCQRGLRCSPRTRFLKRLLPGSCGRRFRCKHLRLPCGRPVSRKKPACLRGRATKCGEPSFASATLWAGLVPEPRASFRSPSDRSHLPLAKSAVNDKFNAFRLSVPKAVQLSSTGTLTASAVDLVNLPFRSLKLPSVLVPASSSLAVRTMYTTPHKKSSRILRFFPHHFPPCHNRTWDRPERRQSNGKRYCEKRFRRPAHSESRTTHQPVSTGPRFVQSFATSGRKSGDESPHSQRG